MTNFNGINPWMNLLNYLNNVKQNTTGDSQQTQNTQNLVNAQNSPMAQLNSTLSTNTFSKIPQNYFNTPQVEQTQQNVQQDIIKMNNEIVQKYLQSMLNMPESLDKLLNSAHAKNIDLKGYQFLKLFVENMLNCKELSQLLNQNSQEAIQKLLNTITQALKQNIGDVSQLKEILSVMNTIHSASNMNSNTLRELFLLYIPIDYQVFKQDSNFDKISGDCEDNIKESTLSLLIETYSFSNILVTLIENQGIITAEVRAHSDFPYEKFKSIVITLSKENSLNVLCDFIKIKEYGTKGQKQNFKVISNDYVPISVLSSSQIIIKTIFKLDNDINNFVEE